MLRLEPSVWSGLPMAASGQSNHLLQLCTLEILGPKQSDAGKGCAFAGASEMHHTPKEGTAETPVSTKTHHQEGH